MFKKVNNEFDHKRAASRSLFLAFIFICTLKPNISDKGCQVLYVCRV